MEKDNSSPGKPNDLSEEEYYADWINIDANLEVACKPNEEYNCTELLARANVDDTTESDSNDQGGDESDDQSPSNKEIIDAVTVQHRADSAFFHTHYSYEREIMKLVEDGKKQTTFDQFFVSSSYIVGSHFFSFYCTIFPNRIVQIETNYLCPKEVHFHGPPKKGGGSSMIPNVCA